MKTCKTCVYWYEDTQRSAFPNGYRACNFFRNDDSGLPNGVSIDFDDAYYGGTITTGPYFGCLRHVEITSEAIAAALMRDAEAEAYVEKRRREPAVFHGRPLLDQMASTMQEHWLGSIRKQLLTPDPFVFQGPHEPMDETKPTRYVRCDPTVKEEKK